MSRGRSSSPRPLQEADVDMNGATAEADPSKKDAKVVIITNLTRNVVESHLRTIFGFYGQITKIDLPLYANSGQNRGKAALEYVDAESANKAASHMDGGQLDGAIVKVELSNLPVRSRSRSPRPTRPIRNGRPKSYSRSRTHSLSRSRSRSPAPRRRSDFRDSYRGGRGAGFGGRRGPPGRGPYRPRSPRSSSPEEKISKLLERWLWQVPQVKVQKLFRSLQSFPDEIRLKVEISFSLEVIFFILALQQKQE